MKIDRADTFGMVLRERGGAGRIAPVLYTLRLPGDLFGEVARAAQAEETTFSDMAIDLIEAGLQARGR